MARSSESVESALAASMRDVGVSSGSLSGAAISSLAVERKEAILRLTGVGRSSGGFCITGGFCDRLITGDCCPASLELAMEEVLALRFALGPLRLPFRPLVTQR